MIPRLSATASSTATLDSHKERKLLSILRGDEGNNAHNQKTRIISNECTSSSSELACIIIGGRARDL